MTLKLGDGASITAKAIGPTSIDLYNYVLLLEDVLMPIKTLSLSLVWLVGVMNSILAEMYVKFLLEINW